MVAGRPRPNRIHTLSRFIAQVFRELDAASGATLFAYLLYSRARWRLAVLPVKYSIFK
jgi:hypothetical protein